VTEEVLGEIGALDGRRMLVLNKMDKCTPEQRQDLASRYPEAALVCAKDPEDVKRLHKLIVDDFESLLEDVNLVVPYAKSSLIGEAHKRARIVSESYEDDGVHYELRMTQVDAAKLRRMLD
jgi:GTP-binding protein HflX